MPKIPVGLQEAVTLLVNPDTRQRPTALVLSRIKYFRYFVGLICFFCTYFHRINNLKALKKINIKRIKHSENFFK